MRLYNDMLANVNVIYYVHICEMRGIALYKIYVLLLVVVIPPRLSDPGSFIPVPLVTRQPEQTTLLFGSAACSVGLTSYGFTQPTGDSRCSPDSNLVSHFTF